MNFRKKQPVKPVERFEFVTPHETLAKVAEIGAKNIKFQMKPFEGMKVSERLKYLVVKEEGVWYLRLC